MQLKKIQLAGFKSFVDSTTLHMDAGVIGIVGPNGCGKSNVIDAVRWVMGEMSARSLRGDNMADVIFNGSTDRKPVGKASVELVFDNSDKTLDGPYGVYTDIAVKRQLSRDGRSDYSINGQTCRRRDITDIFLGTGLGSKSYSIIEQGMVTRIIEARPEDLRLFVEEASGISRYRERRRETELRIRHTRENLSRIEDIRTELDVQLRRLERQAKAAERYRQLKREGRSLEAQLYAVQWRQLSTSLDAEKEQESAIEERLAIRGRAVEDATGEIEEIRGRQRDTQQDVNKAQADFYQVESEVSNIRSRIQHARDGLESTRTEHERLTQSVQDAEQQLVQEQHRLKGHIEQIQLLEPDLAKIREQEQEYGGELLEAEQALTDWQVRWDDFAVRAGEPDRAKEGHSARILEIERHIEKLGTRRGRVEKEVRRIEAESKQIEIEFLLTEIESGEKDWQDCQSGLAQLDCTIATKRNELRAATAQVEDIREQLQQARVQLASLEELQATARNESSEEVRDLLEQHGFSSMPRLIDLLEVNPGWELAVDAVLGHRAGALTVTSLDEVTALAKEFVESGVAFRIGTSASFLYGTGGNSGTLASQVRSSRIDVRRLFGKVILANSVDEAMQRRGQLEPGACLVTQSGVVVDADGYRFYSSNDLTSGVLTRDLQIKKLATEIDGLEGQQQRRRQQVELIENALHEQDDSRTALRHELGELSVNRAELEKNLGRSESRITQAEARRRELDIELSELVESEAQDNALLTEAQQAHREAIDAIQAFEQQRPLLIDNRDRTQSQLEETRQKVASATEQRHGIELTAGKLTAARESASGNIERLNVSLQEMRERQLRLVDELARAEDPDSIFGPELTGLEQRRVNVEASLAEHRDKLEKLEQQHSEKEQQRAEIERSVASIREELEARRMARQEIVLRRENTEQRIRELGEPLEQVLENIDEELDEGIVSEHLDKVNKGLERIGAVNLVAIDEFKEQSERKETIDRQYEDLLEAIAQLEAAIAKIDKETKDRFQNTFNALNENFKSLFPLMFGGGAAELQLTDDDLLTTGVVVTAQPPGKRNTSIALLSGGEKTMTAVALLFSLFRLNPAPFCLLDEVDAPLDDANVERYCRLLRELAKHTQLIFITHNKITMETAEVLTGVTMGEPGVSRLVSVDIDQALSLAAAQQ